MIEKCGEQRNSYYKKYREMFTKPISRCVRDHREICGELYEEKLDANVRRTLIRNLRAYKKTDDIEMLMALHLRSQKKKARQAGPKEEWDEDLSVEQDEEEYDSGNRLYALQMEEPTTNVVSNWAESNEMENSVETDHKLYKLPATTNEISEEHMNAWIKHVYTHACAYSFCQHPRLIIMQSLPQRKAYIDCAREKCAEEHALVEKKFYIFSIIMQTLGINIDTLHFFVEQTNASKTTAKDDQTATKDSEPVENVKGTRSSPNPEHKHEDEESILPPPEMAGNSLL